METISSWNGIIFMVMTICFLTIITYIIQICLLKRRATRFQALIHYHQCKNHYLVNLGLVTIIFSAILLMMLLTFIINTFNFYHLLKPQSIAIMIINFALIILINLGTIVRCVYQYQPQFSADLSSYQNYLKYRKYLKKNIK